MRDRVQLFRFGGDEVSARGCERVHVSDSVDCLPGDGADLVSVGFDHPFVTPREQTLGGRDLAGVVQRIQGGLRVSCVCGGCCGWRVGASGGGDRERDGGDKGGEAACECVHGVFSYWCVVLSGVIVSCFRVLRLRVWMRAGMLFAA